MTRVAARLAAAALAGGSLTALAHSFDERYDLPAPLSYFVAGAAAVVALSFVVAVLFAWRAPSFRDRSLVIRIGPMLPALRLVCWVCRALSLFLFCLAIAAGLFGTGDPLMNLAPTLIWIVWWIGLSLLVACIGNVWPALDPWRTMFDGLDALARRGWRGWRGRRGGIALDRPYPRSLGAWPAVALLLIWAWLELVYPLATAPNRVAWAALAWSAFTLLGMICFGRETWQRNVDVFAIYFAILGRFAPLAVGANVSKVSKVSTASTVPAVHSVVLRLPGAGLIIAGDEFAPDSATAATVGFVVAMLATVLFDGLHGGEAWRLVEAMLHQSIPRLLDVNGYVAGTIGLIVLWLLFLAAYWATCFATAWLVRAGSHAGTDIMATTATIARGFAWTLVPIAIGYNLAHNFSGLLIQGQNVIPLLSDPFGLRWNLFGTAHMYPDIGIVDAKTTWYVAVGAIVAGHVIAVWLAHRVALREFGAPRRAATACMPLTALMVAYTAVSLAVIAEPMVKFLPRI